MVQQNVMVKKLRDKLGRIEAAVLLDIRSSRLSTRTMVLVQTCMLPTKQVRLQRWMVNHLALRLKLSTKSRKFLTVGPGLSLTVLSSTPMVNDPVWS